MKHNYLEVTFRKGQPLAAYYYLPRRDDDKVARTERVGGGVLVDYTADGRAIGIEISAPAQLELSQLSLSQVSRRWLASTLVLPGF